MKTYRVGKQEIGSVELKCLLVSRGVKVDKEVYRRYSGQYRLHVSPLACDCMLLSDGTVVQLTDMGFHLRYLTGTLSWSNLKLLKYASQLGTPFTVEIAEGRPALLHNGEWVDFISFPPATGFYAQKTASGLPFIGNAVIQGFDWAAFQCLWPCEYAAAGAPCEFCFSGAEFEALAKKKKPLPAPLPAQDMAEIVDYAVKTAGVSGVQITGGSTFDGKKESEAIFGYLRAIASKTGVENLPCGILLYITPPEDSGLIDAYFAQGADKIACSLEVWDRARAEVITPGKMRHTGRGRHLETLEYIAEKYGPSKAFSNFIIGLEGIDTLREGAQYLAERGILPSASVWMPMGRPVMGSMQAPEVDYYRRVKELFAELYVKHGLEPAPCRGLNVCIERDIWRWAME